MGCLFTFLGVWFATPKSLILMKFNLSLFLVPYAFVVVSKKPLPKLRSQRSTPMFSSKSFIVLILTAKAIIHFELIFVCGMGKETSFILLHVDI